MTPKEQATAADTAVSTPLKPQRRVSDDLLRQRLAETEFLVGQEWRIEALCAQTDPEVFYPHDEQWSESAKRVCAGCPVVAQCLAYALLAGEPFGVWGGLTTDERTVVAAALRVLPAAPGERAA